MGKWQFHGELAQLQETVAGCGLVGDWTENPQAKNYTFRAKTGEVLNWWPLNGTLNTQGANSQQFREQVEAKLRGEAAKPAAKSATASDKKIFIVHGHDTEARDQLELVLRRLGLEPFILQNAAAESKTIIEALEQHIYKGAAFGIVLMTPDDFGYPRGKADADRLPRARQNVILEMGMVMAALGRPRMAILKKGALEMPSDAHGIVYLEFNQHAKEIVPKLAQCLQAAGFDIDPQKIAAASA